VKRRPRTSHRAPHGVAPAEPAYVRAIDPGPAELAGWQSMIPDWLLMWSPWRRAWTAMARFGAQPIIIDDRNIHHLLAQCQRAEMAAAYGQRETRPMVVALNGT
jgi:hypothetical protein